MKVTNIAAPVVDPIARGGLSQATSERNTPFQPTAEMPST